MYLLVTSLSDLLIFLIEYQIFNSHSSIDQRCISKRFKMGKILCYVIKKFRFLIYIHILIA